MSRFEPFSALGKLLEALVASDLTPDGKESAVGYRNG